MLQNILTLLDKKNHASIIFQDKKFSCKQLISRSMQLTAPLKNMVDATNKPIAFYMPNSPELLCWQLACFHLGIPIVPIIYEHDSRFVQEALKLTQAKYLVTTTEKKQALTANSLSISFVINDDKYENISKCPELSFSPSKVDENDLAMIIFSSGTSGVLKGIEHSYKTAYGFMETLIEILDIQENLIYVTAQPMGHIGGITTPLITLLYDGTSILLENFEINNYMHVINSHRPTHLNLHTPLYYQVISYPNIDKNSFSRVHTAFAGGDTIPNDLAEKFSNVTGAPMQTGYGMTETGIVIINNSPYGKLAGSCGKKISAAQIELRDENGSVVDINEAGEMWVQSPGNCLGYWNMPELNAATMINGWFRTHDLAYVDSNGYFWYLGRDSQIIKSGNQIIYLDKIEKVLFECPEINTVAVISYKNINSKTVPIAFVQPNESNDKDDIKQKIQSYANQHLTGDMQPQQIIIIDKMPLNLTGKIDRNALKNDLKNHLTEKDV